MPLHAQWSVKDDDPRPRPKELGYLYQTFSRDDWNKSNFAAEKDLQWFRDAKYGMFVHFGLSTYKNAELSWGICQTRKAPDGGAGPYPDAESKAWKNEFRLPDFDAGKMVDYAKQAGMKYLVVITPFLPPSGPTQWLFQRPPAESKFLAVVTTRLTSTA